MEAMKDQRPEVVIVAGEEQSVTVAKLVAAGFDQLGAERLAQSLAGVSGRAELDALGITERDRLASVVRFARTSANIATPCCGPSVRCGRNDPCPCRSGKKFKHCHMRTKPLARAK